MTPPANTDHAARFPLLSEAGRQRLRWLEEHPQAPRFNHLGVDRLTAAGAERVAAFERDLRSGPRGWPAGTPPRWVTEFAAFCCREVPAYRDADPPAHFHDLPTSDRSDLSRAPWAFVPDSQPLEGLIVFQTSGATGHPLNIITHPEVLAHYWPLLRAALDDYGVALEPARDDGPPVSVLVVCYQATTYTYAALSAYLNQAGLTKINLLPADWRDPADRASFLDACQPGVYTGDPVSLAELARLPLATRPHALVSTSMALLPGLRDSLAARFGCPVVDVYSMNEAGPIAVAAPSGVVEGSGHWLLSHRLYVEVLDLAGAPCPPGERGEITLTGGFNPFLPLLRYRTGDFASLDTSDPRRLRLVGLEGRAPIIFTAADGRPINNIDVTAALKRLALPQYNLHQQLDGSLRLRVAAGAVEEAALRATVLSVFGAQMPLLIEPLDPAAEGKVMQYSREGGAVSSTV
jgi:phenylacetate-coenzyme A ligase PaaK-like adenylate-forming protein